MAVAARAVHAPNGFFITAEGWEDVTNLATAAVAVAAIGPGRLSIDRLTGLDRRLTGAQRAAIAVGLGLGCAAVQLRTFWSKPMPVPAGVPSETRTSRSIGS
jgi:putative oxidoreductase